VERIERNDSGIRAFHRSARVTFLTDPLESNSRIPAVLEARDFDTREGNSGLSLKEMSWYPHHHTVRRDEAI
jgi:hypothetical protein